MKQTIIPPSASEASFRPALVYGGIMARFLALLVDKLIVSLATFILFIPLGLVAALGSLALSPAVGVAGGIVSPSLLLFAVFLDWIYFAGMESSQRGATFGKRLFGLRVTDEKGGKITFARASIRYFSKILSALPFMLGFVMAFFTRKKQALHDLLAETVVVRF